MVAPMRTMSPDSTWARRASCCALLKRWISSMKTMVRRPSRRRRSSASFRISRSSLTPERTALIASKWARVGRRITWARVVLPEPGGPQRIRERSASVSMARRRGVPGPRASSCPRISSSVRGRMRSARGASGPLGFRGRSPRGRGSPTRRGRAPGHRARRLWRAASKSRIPAATPTFRLSTLPRIGIDTRWSVAADDLLREPRALVAEQEGDRPAEVGFVVAHRGRGVGRHGAHAAEMQEVDGALGAQALGVGEAEGAPHGAAERLPGVGVDRSLGEERTRGARGLGRAEESARGCRGSGSPRRRAVSGSPAKGRLLGEDRTLRQGHDPLARLDLRDRVEKAVLEKAHRNAAAPVSARRRSRPAGRLLDPRRRGDLRGSSRRPRSASSRRRTPSIRARSSSPRSLSCTRRLKKGLARLRMTSVAPSM